MGDADPERNQFMRSFNPEPEKDKNNQKHKHTESMS